MRIGYFGDGPWAHQAFDRILRDGRFEILFVVPRHPAMDGQLKARAEQAGIPSWSSRMSTIRTSSPMCGGGLRIFWCPCPSIRS